MNYMADNSATLTDADYDAMVTYIDGGNILDDTTVFDALTDKTIPTISLV